jgi:hypothetical protein
VRTQSALEDGSAVDHGEAAEVPRFDFYIMVEDVATLKLSTDSVVAYGVRDWDG